MKSRRHYLKFTDEMKRTVRRLFIYGQYRPRKSLGYLTPLEYCKKMFKFDFGSRCTSN